MPVSDLCIADALLTLFIIPTKRAIGLIGLIEGLAVKGFCALLVSTF